MFYFYYFYPYCNGGRFNFLTSSDFKTHFSFELNESSEAITTFGLAFFSMYWKIGSNDKEKNYFRIVNSSSRDNFYLPFIQLISILLFKGRYYMNSNYNNIFS